jgi:NADPH-dependent ferric siderophore reductase
MTLTTAPATPGRRRPRFRPVEVVDVRFLSPRLVSITLTGGPDGALDGFHIGAPAQHVKLLIPGADHHTVAIPQAGANGPVWPEDQLRPAVRTYTPRRFDPTTGTLEIQFVVHGDGPASAWAERAMPGDQLAVAGPGGRFPLELTCGPWVIAGDESAIPAIGTLLEALPADATADVYIETEGRADEIEMPLNDLSQLHWLLRAGATDTGSLLHHTLRTAPITPETNVWVACEATAVRRIRHTLLDSVDLNVGQLVTRGYWRAGEANHPDHDHGTDD